MRPTVSVVIAAYNADRFVTEALTSLQAQSDRPFEVVVVDDGSTDKTAAMVDDWSRITRPAFAVRLLRQPVNRGISAARNRAIRCATGDWMAFLDADDVWEPNHLRQLLGAVAAAPGAVLAYGAGRLLTGTEISSRLYDDFWDNPSKALGVPVANTSYLSLNRSALPRLVKGNFIKPSSMMVSSAALRQTGLFDESLGTAEDRELLVRLLLSGTFVYVPVAITQYRSHDDNATHPKNSRRNRENGLLAIQTVLQNNLPTLCPSEITVCTTMINASAREYLDECAGGGIGLLRQGIHFLRQHLGHHAAWRALTPRHLLRAVYKGLSTRLRLSAT